MTDFGSFNDMKFRFGQELAVRDPRAQALVPKFDSRWRVTMLSDPAKRWASSWSELGRQLLDIVRHEFWIGAGQSWRSPGAKSVIVSKIDVGPGPSPIRWEP